MAKAKYAIDKDKNKVYMISHTKAIYDSNGQVLEDRLQNMTTESNNYTDTKVAELINGAPETMDTLSELADAIENNETVVEALNSAIGTKANKTDVDTALDGKLDVDGDATNTTVGFTSASTRTNIATGETQSTLFGKIKKWFSDLKAVAFTGSYSDLTGTPTNATASTSGLMSSADKSKLDGIAEGAQVNSVTGVKGDSETAYRTGNINITKSNVGLGNVPNVTTNNQTPTYTDATTLETLTSGEYISTAFGKIKKAITEFINHKNNKSNPHSVTKSQVGLGNVDNTSDANKPISTAVQNALNDKLDGSWSDANGYANISELSLDVSDAYWSVYGNLGSNNEFAGIYELGVQVSDNRDAIDTKQATITGGASTITSSNLTESRALISNSSGKVAVSDVTSTELSYIDGVTSNIQTQLNAKAPINHRSTATTYGIGTSSYYGHVKLSDSTSSTSSTGSGVAATPAAVKAAYDKANITKNPNATDGDIIPTHLTVGTRDSDYDIGSHSFTSGGINTASANSSAVVGGFSNTASNYNSAVIGGTDNTASGGSTVVMGGYCNTASGESSLVIGGEDNTASGASSLVIGGNNNTALSYQTKTGHYSKDGTAGTTSGTTGDAFIIGNGTSSATANAFRVTYAGGVYGKAAYNSTGADYAEMFEWADDNPNNEDRRGLFAYIENGKMHLATANDTDRHRLGIISARPAVVGDNFDDDWHGKYLTDIFGAVLTQVVHHEAEYRDMEVTDPETGETHIEKVCIHEECDAVEPILNPDYDPEQEYIPRAERHEYDFWSFIGKLVVTDDGTCEAGGYCYPSVNGVATACEDAEKGFYVMERLDETHIRVLVK